MTNSDNVMTLLAEANPIPDVAALERQPQFVRPDHIDVVPVRETLVLQARVRWALVSAVALAAVFAITFFLLTRSSTVEPVETIPGPTLPTTPAPSTEPTVETTDPPSEPSLEGAWAAVSYGLVFQDGRYAVRSGDLAVDAGTYRVEEDELVLISDESSASCSAGSEARFIVELSADALELEPRDDACGLDRGLGSGSKSLQRGDAPDGLPQSALDVTRPISELAGRPGNFVTGRFTPGFSLTLPPRWTFDAANLSLDVDYRTSVRNDDERIVWYRHDNLENLAGVYDYFAAEAVVDASEPRPATIAGFDGLTFDYVNNFESPDDAQFGNSLMSAPGIGVGSPKAPAHYQWRAWALDVNGVMLTIVASFDPVTLPEKSAEVERILESIIWSD